MKVRLRRLELQSQVEEKRHNKQKQLGIRGVKLAVCLSELLFNKTIQDSGLSEREEAPT